MTAFFRVVEAPVDAKENALRVAIRDHASAFDLTEEALRELPGSPFAYWIPREVRVLYRRLSALEGDGRTVKHGAATLDDWRFLRLWYESPTGGDSWVPFVKGGRQSKFYSPFPSRIFWKNDGRELRAYVQAKVGSASRTIQATDYYFRPGITWPLRGVRFSAQAVPRDCIFSVAGKMCFADSDEDLCWLLAIVNSAAFDALLVAFAGKVGGVQYESGLVGRIPIPDLDQETRARFASLAQRGWLLKRALDSASETSHAFLLPAGVNERLTGLDRSAVESELTAISREIDDRTFASYGIGVAERSALERWSRMAPATSDAEECDEDDADDGSGDNSLPTAASDAVISWLVGVAFGRFDPRLASGERRIPPAPDLFAALPERSPAMWPVRDREVGMPPDILVDDVGHTNDIGTHVVNAAVRAKIGEVRSVQSWLARNFFPLHVKMYSKSRRKAPIYWQLATASASYSVWLYIHAFTNDTLFRVQNDYVALKLELEERRLETLRREGAKRKEVAAQEVFVDEIRTFLDEVKRVAPLWRPNLDDGVIINFAPLWRLVPQHKAWQKELKATWDALCEGKYDWAHLAMHLWPERVVPKCATDRSLAIAHGLEELFWIEGGDGKWTPRKTPTRTLDELVRERSSPAVQAARESLRNAPAPGGGGGKRSKRGGGDA